MFFSPRKDAPRHLPDSTGPVEPAVSGEDGAAAPRVERHRLAFAVGSTLAALPILVMDNLPATAESPLTTAVTEAVAEVDLTSTTSAPSTTTAVVVLAPEATEAPTTITVAPTTTTAPTTTASTTAAPTTTTTAPPPPPPPAPTATETGQATWYAQPAGYAPGGCAHKTLPFGTTVTVTNHANGATTACTVNDRGPYGEGRIIDLDDDVFAQLAPLGAGVITVTISW